MFQKVYILKAFRELVGMGQGGWRGKGGLDTVGPFVLLRQLTKTKYTPQIPGLPGSPGQHLWMSGFPSHKGQQSFHQDSFSSLFSPSFPISPFILSVVHLDIGLTLTLSLKREIKNTIVYTVNVFPM